MFPSSFSIAALIGAAAIRKQVATKLGLNVEIEENEEKSEEERKEGIKRRISFENPDEFEIAEKKKCFNDEESNLVTRQKLDLSFRASPFLEQLRFAKCFLKDQKIREEETRGDDTNSAGETRDLINTKSIPRMSLASNQTSMSHDFKTHSRQSNNPTKQSNVNSNTKVLEKVSFHKIILCYTVELSKFCHFHKKFGFKIPLQENLKGYYEIIFFSCNLFLK